MSKVQKGNTIQVHYKGTLTDDGTPFDSSEGREPLEFTVGEGTVIHGFDKGVLDMQVGDKKVVAIPHLEAYGPMNEMMFFEYEKSQLPEDLGELEAGMELGLMDQAGNHFPVIVHEVKEDSIILNGNHPLAGKDLTFEIELVKIVS